MSATRAHDGETRYERIYRVVRRIPRGKVATYGQIATLAGLDGHARQVGYALHALPTGTSVPWHRVINAQGKVSLRSRIGPELEQEMRLRAEGVRFDAAGRVSLKRFGWRSDSRARGGGLSSRARR
jgi:methylated-DNA-protein-cysteine methyltransferase-like protein